MWKQSGLTLIVLYKLMWSTAGDADPCSTYNRLTTDVISGGTPCTGSLTTAWYRFVGNTNGILSNVCPTGSLGRSIWMNDTTPALSDGITDVNICISDSSGCCLQKRLMKTKNCSTFIVFFHRVPPGCPLRYSFENFPVVVTTVSATTSTTLTTELSMSTETTLSVCTSNLPTTTVSTGTTASTKPTRHPTTTTTTTTTVSIRSTTPSSTTFTGKTTVRTGTTHHPCKLGSVTRKATTCIGKASALDDPYTCIGISISIGVVIVILIGAIIYQEYYIKTSTCTRISPGNNYSESLTVREYDNPGVESIFVTGSSSNPQTTRQEALVEKQYVISYTA